MKSFFELNGRGKIVEWLRWIGVLPAALLDDIAYQIVVGVVFWLAAFGGLINLDSSGFGYYLQLLLYYVPKKAAFVIVGAKMAPRRRLATAIVLAVLGILFRS